MNVYYLPARQDEMSEILATASRWSVLKARLHRAWWRLRLTTTEVWAVLRCGGQRRLFDDVWFADEIPAPRRRALGPARIIDLDAARRRRTPAVVSARA